MPFAHPHRRSQAFTLLELLTVMGVVAVLMTITITIIRGAKQRASLAQARSELAILVQALEEYKRHYGDYPWTGPSTALNVRVTGTVGPGLTTVPARLLNALIGVYGPKDFTTRLNGPMFADVDKLTLEVPFSTPTAVTTNLRTTFAVPTGTPPTKPPANNSFVDPWGNRYLYFYKSVPLPGRPAVTWAAPSFVLYSAGPDGAATLLPGANGLFAAANQTTGDNADNIYADKLP
ncbi:MAG: prepilin-type N-terminal cleavage/methylation domain-containing protein [Verrucomicrobia bacterium]|nr:prepilin-type N-terminal cleavage/methylation domain-containing protein [Verrucomicrobiota bacterium]